MRFFFSSIIYAQNPNECVWQRHTCTQTHILRGSWFSHRDSMRRSKCEIFRVAKKSKKRRQNYARKAQRLHVQPGIINRWQHERKIDGEVFALWKIIVTWMREEAILFFFFSQRPIKSSCCIHWQRFHDKKNESWMVSSLWGCDKGDQIPLCSRFNWDFTEITIGKFRFLWVMEFLLMEGERTTLLCIKH